MMALDNPIEGIIQHSARDNQKPILLLFDN